MELLVPRYLASLGDFVFLPLAVLINGSDRRDLLLREMEAIPEWVGYVYLVQLSAEQPSPGLADNADWPRPPRSGPGPSVAQSASSKQLPSPGETLAGNSSFKTNTPSPVHLAGRTPELEPDAPRCAAGPGPRGPRMQAGSPSSDGGGAAASALLSPRWRRKGRGGSSPA